jgi:hypothetical protein
MEYTSLKKATCGYTKMEKKTLIAGILILLVVFFLGHTLQKTEIEYVHDCSTCSYGNQTTPPIDKIMMTIAYTLVNKSTVSMFCKLPLNDYEYGDNEINGQVTNATIVKNGIIQTYSNYLKGEIDNILVKYHGEDILYQTEVLYPELYVLPPYVTDDMNEYAREAWSPQHPPNWQCSSMQTTLILNRHILLENKTLKEDTITCPVFIMRDHAIYTNHVFESEITEEVVNRCFRDFKWDYEASYNNYIHPKIINCTEYMNCEKITEAQLDSCVTRFCGKEPDYISNNGTAWSDWNTCRMSLPNESCGCVKACMEDRPKCTKEPCPKIEIKYLDKENNTDDWGVNARINGT